MSQLETARCRNGTLPRAASPIEARTLGTVLAFGKAVCDENDKATGSSVDQMPIRPRTFFWLAGWVVAIAGLLVGISQHAAIAGDDLPGLTAWPAESTIARAAGRSTILCFVHPRCACTEATLRELERVVSRTPSADIRIVFREDPTGDLASSATWTMAESVPGAVRILDVDGLEAARFGAQTSGLVLLFDAAGALRFRGGITSARGHEGDSAGALALESALRSNVDGTASIFGCGLEERQPRGTL